MSSDSRSAIPVPLSLHGKDSGGLTAFSAARPQRHAERTSKVYSCQIESSLLHERPRKLQNHSIIRGQTVVSSRSGATRHVQQISRWKCSGTPPRSKKLPRWRAISQSMRYSSIVIPRGCWRDRVAPQVEPALRIHFLS